MQATQDVLPAANDVALGPGWYPLESFRGESYRWILNDAVIYVATLRRLEHQVQIQIEPGPGVGLKPFSLKVLDRDGKTVATLNVRGRETVSFVLPAGEPTAHKLTLHTDEGGKSSPGDPRVLNFRVFKISVQRMPAEVFPPGAGFRLGSGWYPLETFSGESFRWVNNDATIEVANGSAQTLTLKVEPGPGVEMKPFTLKILDGAGREITSAEVKARQQIDVPLAGLSYPAIVRLHVDGGGRRSSNDARIMNFRVFEHDPIAMLEGPKNGAPVEKSTPAR